MSVIRQPVFDGRVIRASDWAADKTITQVANDLCDSIDQEAKIIRRLLPGILDDLHHDDVGYAIRISIVQEIPT